MHNLDSQGIGNLLSRTRQALLSGDLALIGDLAAQLESATENLHRLSPAEARLIRDMAAGNDGLLTAAAKGVRAARQRLRDLSDEGRFSTYGSDGSRNQPGMNTGMATRRL